MKDSGLSTFWYKKDNVYSVQAWACLNWVEAAHHLLIYFFSYCLNFGSMSQAFLNEYKKVSALCVTLLNSATLTSQHPCWKKATKSYKLSLCCLLLFPSPSFQSYPASWAALFTSSVDMKWSNHIYLNIHYRSCHHLSLLAKKIVFQEQVLKLYNMDPLTR